MKKLIWILSLAATSCQHAAPQKAVSNTVAPRPTAAAVPPGQQVIEGLPSLFSAADTLTRPMRDLLRAQNLAALWQHYDTVGVEPDPTFQGFFGPDHYRFAMVFNRVSRDPNNPAVYHLAGKCRYRKNIRPFSGTLTVRQIKDLNYPGFLQARATQFSEPADSIDGRMYTARAQLQLQEERKENSGIFEGEILLDFYAVPGHEPDYVYVFDREGHDDRLPTRGSGVLLRGNRRNVSTGQVKSFTVAPDVAAVAPDVFKDFMLDERMGEINPKYVKLGWNEFWNNDEWWAKSPKPTLL